MGKSFLYAVNTASQTVASGSTVNFGSVVRKSGCNCVLSGGNIETNGSGFYSIDCNITIVSAGTYVVTLYKSGSPITGANATVTIATDGDGSVSIPCVTRNYCCRTEEITAEITGATATVTNATIRVEKL